MPASSVRGKNSSRDFSFAKLEPGGRGRIRTFVARKERQIYSLLVLATHPPVPETSAGIPKSYPRKLQGHLSDCPVFDCHAVVRECVASKTQNGLVSKDTSPFMLPCRESSRLAPL